MRQDEENNRISAVSIVIVFVQVVVITCTFLSTVFMVDSHDIGAFGIKSGTDMSIIVAWFMRVAAAVLMVLYWRRLIISMTVYRSSLSQ